MRRLSQISVVMIAVLALAGTGPRAQGTGGEKPPRRCEAGEDEKKHSRKRVAAGGDDPPRVCEVGAGVKRSARRRVAGTGEERAPREVVAGMGEERPSREIVAGAGEVLEYLTCVLRGEEDGESKNTSARMKAAELLGKRMGLFEEGAEAVQEPVVIIDDVRMSAESTGTVQGPGVIAGSVGAAVDAAQESAVSLGGARLPAGG
jgi:hypothetical protein